MAGEYPAKTIRHIHIPVDLTRFAPRPKDGRLLAEFNLTADQPVAGIVARVQRHRRFDLLLQALRLVVPEVPDVKFLIIGRGTHIDEIARQPVLRLGLQNNVVFTGYRDEDFVDVLNLLDFKVFLVPGSDGACRAAREALACAKPVVATRRGILPELLVDGETGLLIDEDPESLARAIINLCSDSSRLRKMAQNARRYARETLDPQRCAAEVAGCYKRLMETFGRNSKRKIQEFK